MNNKRKFVVAIVCLVLLVFIGLGISIYRKNKVDEEINVLVKKLKKSVAYDDNEKKDKFIKVYYDGLEKKSAKEKREYKSNLETFTEEVREKNKEEIGGIITSLKAIDFKDAEQYIQNRMIKLIEDIEKAFIKNDFKECDNLLKGLGIYEKGIKDTYIINGLEGVYKKKVSSLSGGYSSTDITVTNKNNDIIKVVYRQQNANGNGGGDALYMEGTIRRVSGTIYEGRISTGSSAFGGIDSYEDIDIIFEKDKATVIFGRGEAVVLPRIDREDKFS